MKLADVSRLAAQLDGVTERRREGLLDWRYRGRLVAPQLDDSHIVIRLSFDFRGFLLSRSRAAAAQRASDPRQNNRHRCLGVRRQPACRASLSATSPARNTPTSPITIWIPQMTSRKLEAALSLVR